MSVMFAVVHAGRADKTHGRYCMRKLFCLITLLLGFSATCAHAQWARVGQTRLTIIYVDQATRQQLLGGVSMDSLNDYQEPQKAKEGLYRSLKTTFFYDCVNFRRRFVARVNYSGAMATGAVVAQSVQLGMLMSISPGAVEEGLWKIACGKP